MRVYEVALALVLTLVLILYGVLKDRSPLKPRCPKCGARRGQRTITQEETWSRDVMFAERDFGYRWPTPERLKVRRQTILNGVVECSRCGERYEHTWFAEKGVL